MAKISTTSHAEHGLQRQLGLPDLVLAQVLCVVGSGWVGVAAELGKAQALTWIAAMLLFYFPMAAVVIGLNRIMPLEGGLYVWAHRAFGGLRFLDLDDHLGARKDFLRCVDHNGAGSLVCIVRQTDLRASRRLYDNLMPVRHQFANARRRQPDAIFVVLDFFWQTDMHDGTLLLK